VTTLLLFPERVPHPASWHEKTGASTILEDALRQCGVSQLPIHNAARRRRCWDPWR
jgi:hypothetical protein